LFVARPPACSHALPFTGSTVARHAKRGLKTRRSLDGEERNHAEHRVLWLSWLGPRRCRSSNR